MKNSQKKSTEYIKNIEIVEKLFKNIIKKEILLKKEYKDDLFINIIKEEEKSIKNLQKKLIESKLISNK